VFHVNWFRRDNDGRFLWPGFGDNLRVLEWIIDRCEGRAAAVEQPIGYLPAPSSLDLAGLSLRDGALNELLAVDPAAWSREVADIRAYLAEFGDRVPQRLRAQLDALASRLP